MTGRLAGRVCLVTGSTGIAAAAARRLAGEGAAVFVASRTGEHAAALAASIEAAGGRAGWADADLTDVNGIDAPALNVGFRDSGEHEQSLCLK